MSKRRKMIEVPNFFQQDIEIPEGLKNENKLKFKPVVARTKNQKEYIKSIISNDITFAVGCPGTGKTRIAIGIAYEMLMKGETDRIVISRPAIEAEGEKLGFRPGDIKEKMHEFLIPIYDELLDFTSQSEIDRLIKERIIDIVPLCFMRGRNLKGTVILDEAQNATIKQLKLLLTRMCEGAKIILTGDPNQSDLGQYDNNDFYKLSKSLTGIDGIGVIYLEKVDVQRHKLVNIITDIIEGIDKPQSLEERFVGYREYDGYDRNYSQLYD